MICIVTPLKNILLFRYRIYAFLLSVLLLTGNHCAHAIIRHHEFSDATYLEKAKQYPSVGIIDGRSKAHESTCTGTLVSISDNPQYDGHVILTLAHCLRNFPASVYFFSVMHNDGTLSYTNIVRKFVHPQAGNVALDDFDPYDLALAVVKPPILDRKPMTIADTGFLKPIPQKMVTVGFGVTGRGDKDFFIEDRRGRAMESIIREPTDVALKGKAIQVEFTRQNPGQLLAGMPHYGDCGAPGIMDNHVIALALQQEELDRNAKKWTQGKNIALPGQTGAYAHPVPGGSLKITDAVRVDAQGNAYFDSLIADAERQVQGPMRSHFPSVHHFYDQYHSQYISLSYHNAWLRSAFQKDIGKYINSHQGLYPGITPTRIPNDHKSAWLRLKDKATGENAIPITAIVEENDRCWLQYYTEYTMRLCWNKDGNLGMEMVSTTGLLENNMQFDIAHAELLDTGERYKGDL